MFLVAIGVYLLVIGASRYVSGLLLFLGLLCAVRSLRMPW